jgi:hypothetical protein
MVEINSVAILVCTHSPSLDKLKNVFEHIYSNSGSYRVLLIDNASNNSEGIKNLNFYFPFEYHFEPVLGIASARRMALKLLKPDELAIFVDDDNYLGSEYISSAQKLANRHPGWGVFGGRQIPVDAHIYSSSLGKFLPYLGIRDLGDSQLTEPASLYWRALEPIGAGMCLRPEVITTFNSLQESGMEFLNLGRKGRSLLSGEDSFIARQAYFANLSWGYSPELVLTHDINSTRLRRVYLLRLLFAYGRSDVKLNNALKVQPEYRYAKNLLVVFLRFFYTAKKHKKAWILSFRHLGEYYESRK